MRNQIHCRFVKHVKLIKKIAVSNVFGVPYSPDSKLPECFVRISDTHIKNNKYRFPFSTQADLTIMGKVRGSKGHSQEDDTSKFHKHGR